MPFDSVKARDYVQALDMSGTPRHPIAQGPGDEAKGVFDDAKKQSLIVGSGVFAFEQGVTTQTREAISNAALLAQLVANKRVDAEAKPLEWFKAYLDVLTNVGWNIQESGWVDYTTRGTSAQVHEKILEVATAAFAGSPALAILTASINSLKAMNPNSPWITLFDREAQKARIARFQVGFTSTEADGDVFVSLLACLIQAHGTITQVLFFRFRDEGATFQADTAKVSVNKASITDLAESIRDKVRAYQQDYLSGILDLS